MANVSNAVLGSLCITAIILAAAAMYLYFVRQRRGFRIPTCGCDLLARCWMESLQPGTACVAAFLLWGSIATALSILLGKTANNAFLASFYGILTTVTYALFVPLMLAVYLNLLDILSRTVDVRQLADLSLSDDDSAILRLSNEKRMTLFAMGHVVLICAALFVQWTAIMSEQQVPSPDSPWVDGDELNWRGSIYYAFRGLNAYLALGMFCTLMTLFYLFCGRLRPEDPCRLFTANLQAKPLLNELGTALLAVVVVSTVVLTLHGVGLVLHVAELGKPLSFDTATKGKLYDLLVSSSWIGWLVIFALSTTFCIAITYRFHNHLVLGATALHSKAIESIGRAIDDPSEPARQEPSARVAHSTSLWEARQKIRDEFKHAQLWPLPSYGRIVLVISVIMQLANMLATGFIEYWKPPSSPGS